MEAAVIHGAFWMAGEYGVTSTTCSAAAACLGEVTLQGGYAEAGIFLGGRKTYKGGRFNRSKVDTPLTKGGMGALAFVARFDTIDLTSVTMGTGVNGGSFNSYILGADWWPTKYTRLGVNYFNTDANLGSFTSGLDQSFAALVGIGAPAEKVAGVIIRGQFDF